MNQVLNERDWSQRIYEVHWAFPRLLNILPAFPFAKLKQGFHNFVAKFIIILRLDLDMGAQSTVSFIAISNLSSHGYNLISRLKKEMFS